MLEIIFTGIGSAIFSVVVYLYKNWRKTTILQRISVFCDPEGHLNHRNHQRHEHQQI